MQFKNTAGCCLFAILLLPSGSACAADLPSAGELQKLGLEKRWESQAVLDLRRDSIAHVTNDENNVYVQSSAGVLTVFDAENGRKLWSAQVGRTDEASMAVTSNKDMVLVVVGPTMYGFNKFTGDAQLQHRLPRQPSASPVMNEAVLFVPISGGAIYAYSLGVLKYKYRYGTLPDTSPRSFLWRFIGGEEVITQPVLGKLAMAFATGAGNLQSIDITGSQPGKTRFQMQLTEPASAPLSIADNESSSSVVMLSGDNQVFSLDLVTGAAEWVYPVGRNMKQAPIIINNDVFVVTTEGTLTRISRDRTIPMGHGRPLEIPKYVSPLYIGTALQAAEVDADMQAELRLPSTNVVEVLDVSPNSPAEMAGIRAGDRIVRVDGLSATSVDEARDLLAELPPRLERPIELVRDGKLVKIKIRIPVDKWDVRGISRLTAVGRFNVYGVDQANRLVAFDLETAKMVGRVAISGFNFPHQNHITDQLYLVASNGEIACLREIGPTIRVPDLGPTTRTAKVISVNVKVGDGSETAGTQLCELELPDGTIQPVSANVKGVVRSLYVTVGQTVYLGNPIALIGDDKFATYYRNPDQRPVDIELSDEFPADPNGVQ